MKKYQSLLILSLWLVLLAACRTQPAPTLTPPARATAAFTVVYAGSSPPPLAGKEADGLPVAAKLGLAQSKGTLHLSLRGDVDSNTAPVNTVTLKELRFQQMGAMAPASDEPKEPEPEIESEPPAVAMEPPLPVYQIRVLRGSTVSSISVKGVRDDRRP